MKQYIPIKIFSEISEQNNEEYYKELGLLVISGISFLKKMWENDEINSIFEYRNIIQTFEELVHNHSIVVGLMPPFDLPGLVYDTMLDTVIENSSFLNSLCTLDIIDEQIPISEIQNVIDIAMLCSGSIFCVNEISNLGALERMIMCIEFSTDNNTQDVINFYFALLRMILFSASFITKHQFKYYKDSKDIDDKLYYENLGFVIPEKVKDIITQKYHEFSQN